jgi:hypothetical protein
VTLDSKNRVAVWDIAHARLLEEGGCMSFEEKLAASEVQIAVPTWCAVDARLGVGGCLLI